jgi:hypothetical protein
MSEEMNFRTSINGFNRKDVVRYIEFLNNKHAAQINQIRTETDELRAELALARQAPARSMRLEAELAATKKRCADLEAALAAVSSQIEQPAPAPVAVVETPVEDAAETVAAPVAEPVAVPAPVPAPAPDSRITEELEAYRRAERAERKANERAREICDQANGVLADATARVDDTAAQFAEMAEQIAEQLNLFRELVIGSKATLKDAATAMYAIRPEEDDD